MENWGNNTAKKRPTGAFSCKKMLMRFYPPNHLLISAPFRFSYCFFPGTAPQVSLTLSWTLLCSVLVDSHKVIGCT